MKKVEKFEEYQNKVLELHSKGYSNIQIVNNINKEIVNVKKVVSYLNRINLKSNRYDLLDDTEELEQLILGSVLGDGYLCKYKDTNNFNSRLSIGHGSKQYNYLEHKANILRKYNLYKRNSYTKCTSYSDRYKSPCITYHFKSVTHPIFTKYRDLYYNQDNKKIIVDDIYNLSDLGLAIWFMDDVSLSSSGYQIHSWGFDKKECNLLRDMMFENFKLDTTLQKNNIIYIKINSVKKINDIINPYIIDSLRYKIKEISN